MKRALCLCWLLLPLAGGSQPLTLVWHQIAGGGGMSQTANLQAHGTIGQSVAGGAGPLSAGFWNLDSSGQIQAISPTTPPILLTSSVNPGGYHDDLTFTATLPTDATGNVVFLTNGVPFSTNTLSDGTADSGAANGLPRATANVVAVNYSGDLNYLAATASLIQFVTNHPPSADITNLTLTAGLKLRVFFAGLTNLWHDVDGDPVSLTGVSMTSTNGVSLLTNSLQILYVPSGTVNDQISYSISDGQGGTNLGLINLVLNPFALGTNAPASLGFSNGAISLTYYVTPGYTYITERATNLSQLVWDDIATNTLAATTNTTLNLTNVSFLTTDTHPPSPTAYYRLKTQPAN